MLHELREIVEIAPETVEILRWPVDRHSGVYTYAQLIRNPCARATGGRVDPESLVREGMACGTAVDQRATECRENEPLPGALLQALSQERSSRDYRNPSLGFTDIYVIVPCGPSFTHTFLLPPI
jgi:hypothetical protein